LTENGVLDEAAFEIELPTSEAEVGTENNSLLDERAFETEA
jgi:hypothetical protein